MFLAGLDRHASIETAAAPVLIVIGLGSIESIRPCTRFRTFLRANQRERDPDDGQKTSRNAEAHRERLHAARLETTRGEFE